MEYIFEPRILMNILGNMDTSGQIVKYMFDSIAAMEAGNEVAWAKSYKVVQKKEKKDALGAYTNEFEIFWKDYPKKIGKPLAFAVWKKIAKKENVLSNIIVALEWQIKSDQWKDIKFIPNPENYLKARRWEDEPPKDAFKAKERYMDPNGIWRER